MGTRPGMTRWLLSWERGRPQRPIARRPQQEPHVEEDLQQITVQVEAACSGETVPKEEDAG